MKTEPVSTVWAAATVQYSILYCISVYMSSFSFLYSVQYISVPLEYCTVCGDSDFFWRSEEIETENIIWGIFFVRIAGGGRRLGNTVIRDIKGAVSRVGEND